MGYMPKNTKVKADQAVGETEYLIKLLGQPHLSDYLNLVSGKVVGGDKMEVRAVADEWRRANDLYYELEKTEAGFADNADCLDPPKRLKPLIEALHADPYFAQTFDTLPTAIKMVELEKLVTSQASITCDFTDGLVERLGRKPDLEALFHFCLPLDRKQAPVTVRKIGSSRYLFVSDSTDFRFHNVEILSAAQVSDLSTFGPVSNILALPVGYGSNFVSVVESEGRLLLQNGYHRCYSMLKAGITHAPAVVQSVTRLDELRIAADEDVCDDPAFYFRAARPPVLKDFLNPKLTRKLHVKKMQTTVEIEFKVRTSTGSVL